MTDSVINPEGRSALIRASMANGLSRDDANIMCDIADFAVQQALEAFMRTLETAPSHLNLNTTSLAVQLFRAQVEHLDQGVKDIAASLGVRAVKVGL